MQSQNASYNVQSAQQSQHFDTISRSNVLALLESSLVFVGDPQPPTAIEVDAFLKVIAATLKRVLAEEAEGHVRSA